MYMQSQTLNIALPEDLIKRVDEVAQKEFRNRSELIREALRRYLDEEKERAEIFVIGEKIMAEMGIKSEAEIDKIVEEYRHGKKAA